LGRGGAAAGTPREGITSATLTALYGTPIEVLTTSDGRLGGGGPPGAPAVHSGPHDPATPTASAAPNPPPARRAPPPAPPPPGGPVRGWFVPEPLDAAGHRAVRRVRVRRAHRRPVAEVPLLLGRRPPGEADLRVVVLGVDRREAEILPHHLLAAGLVEVVDGL